MDHLRRILGLLTMNRIPPIWIALIWISMALSGRSAEIRGMVMDNDSASRLRTR